jgi:hypothetical protein
MSRDGGSAARLLGLNGNPNPIGYHIPTADPESSTPTPSLLSVWRRRRRFLSALSALRPSLLIGRARPARRSCSPCSPLRPAVDLVLVLLGCLPFSSPHRSCSDCSLGALLVDRARPTRQSCSAARLCALRSIGDLVLGCSPCSSPRRSCSESRTARLCALLVSRARPARHSSVVSGAPALKGPSLLSTHLLSLA